MLASLLLSVALPLGSLQAPDAIPALAKQQPEVILLWPNGAPNALGTEAKDKPASSTVAAVAETPATAKAVAEASASASEKPKG